MNRNGKDPVYDPPSDTSPPRTPPSQTSKYQTTRRTPQARPSLRGVFPDDQNVGTDTANSSNTSGDERDPHDLALSPKHAARTSIVDNMLLSLDQFSPNSSVLDDYRLFHSVLEPDVDRNSQDSASNGGRYRGNTFSSSLSSENDPYEEGVSHYGIQTATGRRSNSSSTYPSSLRGTNNTRGYDGFHSQRAQPGPSSRAFRTRKESKGSVSSNNDIAPSVPRARGDLGADRHSIDDGGTTPFPPFHDETPRYNELDELEAAPTPSVPAGPRKFPSTSQSDYPSSLNPQSSRTPVASRRNSARSSNPTTTSTPNATTTTKKKHPGNLKIQTIRRAESDMELHPPPALGADSLDPPAPSPTVSFNKPSFPPPADPPTPKERPGFFRRVFGSSKNSPAQPPAQPPPPPDDPPYPSQDRESIRGGKFSKNDAPAATNISSRQVVNKKSSFFRRRKKSVVDSVPPPIALPQHLAPRKVDLVKAPEPSPVSSLRQVMDPYLADAIASSSSDNPSKEGHGREANVEGAKSVPLPPQMKKGSPVPSTGMSKHETLPPPPAVSSGGPDSSLLANSSGDDASTTKSVDVGGSSPLSSPVQGKDVDAEPLGSPSQQSKLVPPLISVPPTTLSPVVEDFPHKTAPSLESSEAPNPSKLTSPGAESEASNYFTASNTPVITTEDPMSAQEKPTENNVEEGGDPSKDVEENGPTAADREQAQKLFDSQDEVVGNDPAAAWLGDPDRASVREAYMDLFDWSNMHILAGLRSLCGRLVLKGETQQVDRVLDAFSSRWCRCNPNHGFKAAGLLSCSPPAVLLSNRLPQMWFTRFVTLFFC